MLMVHAEEVRIESGGSKKMRRVIDEKKVHGEVRPVIYPRFFDTPTVFPRRPDCYEQDREKASQLIGRMIQVVIPVEKEEKRTAEVIEEHSNAHPPSLLKSGPSLRKPAQQNQKVTLTGSLGVLPTHTDAPDVSQTPVHPDLLQALEVITELRVDAVRQDLRVLPVDDVLLPVQEPRGDLELRGVLHDRDYSLELVRVEVTGSVGVGEIGFWRVG